MAAGHAREGFGRRAGVGHAHEALGLEARRGRYRGGEGALGGEGGATAVQGRAGAREGRAARRGRRQAVRAVLGGGAAGTGRGFEAEWGARGVRVGGGAGWAGSA